MGLDLSKPYNTVRTIVLLPWTISVTLPSLGLDLALISIGIVPTAILCGRKTALSVAHRRLAEWRRKIRELVNPMPSRVPVWPVTPEAAQAYTDEARRNERRQRRLERQRDQREEGPGAFWGADPFIHEPGPDGRPSWRLNRSRPPSDHYDGNCLVPPHFTVTPAMTPLAQAYAYDPPSHNWHAWSTRDDDIQAAMPAIMARHNLHRTGRCGLYICGRAEEIVCSPDVDGYDPAAQRDRMMIFMVELEPADRDKWFDMHAELSTLMCEVGIEEHHGVCIRYYLGEDSLHQVAVPRPRTSQPTADIHLEREGDRVSAAEIAASTAWLARRQSRYPEHSLSVQRVAELLRAHIDASRDSTARTRQRSGTP